MDTLTRMKMLIFRVLKVTAYALGIPLMLYMLSRAVSAAGGYGLIAEQRRLFLISPWASLP